MPAPCDAAATAPRFEIDVTKRLLIAWIDTPLDAESAERVMAYAGGARIGRALGGAFDMIVVYGDGVAASSPEDWTRMMDLQHFATEIGVARTVRVAPPHLMDLVKRRNAPQDDVYAVRYAPDLASAYALLDAEPRAPDPKRGDPAGP